MGMANCAPPGQSPAPQWVNSGSPTRLQVSWRMNYVEPVSVPDSGSAPHVSNSPVQFGLTDARTFTNLSEKSKMWDPIVLNPAFGKLVESLVCDNSSDFCAQLLILFLILNGIIMILIIKILGAISNNAIARLKLFFRRFRNNRHARQNILNFGYHVTS